MLQVLPEEEDSTMIKLVFLIRRKPGMSPHAFREHYETIHADLALTYIRPYLIDYRRSYPQAGSNFLDAVSSGLDIAARAETPYDAITEMWLVDRGAMDAMFKTLADPDVRTVLGEDEARFIDLPSVKMLECVEARSAL
jgi:hypothetical protein